MYLFILLFFTLYNYFLLSYPSLPACLPLLHNTHTQPGAQTPTESDSSSQPDAATLTRRPMKHCNLPPAAPIRGNTNLCYYCYFTHSCIITIANLYCNILYSKPLYTKTMSIYFIMDIVELNIF